MLVHPKNQENQDAILHISSYDLALNIEYLRSSLLGEAIDNYVPYTAEITMTFDTDANTLVVSWEGNDEDGDILTYDIRIEEGTLEIVNEVDLIETNHGPIDAVPGRVYTVEIQSKDTAGNISVSTRSRLME